MQRTVKRLALLVPTFVLLLSGRVAEAQAPDFPGVGAAHAAVENAKAKRIGAERDLALKNAEVEAAAEAAQQTQQEADKAAVAAEAAQAAVDTIAAAIQQAVADQEAAVKVQASATEAEKARVEAEKVLTAKDTATKAAVAARDGMRVIVGEKIEVRGPLKSDEPRFIES